MSAVAFRNVRKAFGAVQALRGVSFDVAPGEAHAIVGENGAGKSTLLKVLAGITRPDAGEIRLDDRLFDCAGPRDALAAGVGLVFQERLAFPNLTVAANIFAGREITRGGGRLDEAAMRARTAELLAGLHLPIPPDRLMEDVSAAHAQLLQVARALAFDCRVLVLDEPTTSLTDAEVDHLFAVLQALKRRGVTIIFVSHRLPEVFRLCDRISVLRDGAYVATVERAQTTPDAVVRAMVGRDVPPRPARRPVDRSRAPALSVRGLSQPGRFNDMSFDVRPGEIVGLFGLVGSGRSELLQALFGLTAPASGRVEVEGREYRATTVVGAMRAGLALVPEDRQQFGLHANLTIRDNLALPLATRRGYGRIRRAEETARGESLVAKLAVRTPSLDAMPDALSGGNQQKVATGRWLALAPRVLLLDEPTKGVDVGAKFEIHELIRAQAASGTACLVVSSDLPEVLAIADRVLVMRAGALVGDLEADEASEAAVMRLATHEAAV